MDPTLLGLIAAALAFIAVGAAGMAFAGPGETRVSEKRVRSIVKETRVTGVFDAEKSRRQKTSDALQNLAKANKSSKDRQASIAGRLNQAGLAITPLVFWAISAAGGIVAAGAAAYLKAGLAAIVGAGVVFGLGLPRWVLGMIISMRHKKFSDQLADAIDVIVRGVRAGLPLNQCMQIIAKESPLPLREEFQRIVDAQTMGVPLDQNLQRFYERAPLPEVNFFSIVLVIQQKAGGNLAEALNNLATVLRARKMLREKIKALSAEAKMSAMIIGAMPFIVAGILMVVNPQYIMILFTTDTGRLVLLVCASLMATGIMVMRNMINFKF